MKHTRRTLYIFGALLSLALAACATGTRQEDPTQAAGVPTSEAPTTTAASTTTVIPTGGPVEIKTEIDFSQEQFSGVFEVTEGAEILGCSMGTFVDTPVSDGVEKLFTCESGNTGTFTAHFVPPQGPWRIVEASGGFSLLRGEGDFIVVEGATADTGLETFTGEISFITEAEAAAETTTTTAVVDDFDFVEVDSLELAYRCDGTGSPTVIILHGLHGPGAPGVNAEWVPTLDALAEITEVCIYERPGLGRSEARPETPQTTQTQVDDLVEFAGAIGVDEPMILIGYSWGGLIGQLLAHQSPDLMGGMVFLDSSHPDQDQRLGSTPPEPFAPEYVDIAASMTEVSVVDDLGDMPLYVLTAGLGGSEEDHEIWIDLQSELAGLSSEATHVIVEDAHHGSIPGEADAIVTAVQELIGKIGTEGS